MDSGATKGLPESGIERVIFCLKGTQGKFREDGRRPHSIEVAAGGSSSTPESGPRLSF